MTTWCTVHARDTEFVAATLVVDGDPVCGSCASAMGEEGIPLVGRDWGNSDKENDGKAETSPATLSSNHDGTTESPVYIRGPYKKGKRKAAADLLMSGESLRATAEKLGISKTTVLEVSKEIERTVERTQSETTTTVVQASAYKPPGMTRQREPGEKFLSHTCECGCGSTTRPGWRFIKGHEHAPAGTPKTGLPIEASPADMTLSRAFELVTAELRMSADSMLEMGDDDFDGYVKAHEEAIVLLQDNHPSICGTSALAAGKSIYERALEQANDELRILDMEFRRIERRRSALRGIVAGLEANIEGVKSTQ